MKLVSTREIPAEAAERMREIVPDLDIVVVSGSDEEALLAAVEDADIIAGGFGGGTGGLFRRMVQAAPRARWIHTSSAGVDDILYPELQERDLVLTCGKGESIANLLAEHAMALLLGLTRAIVPAARQSGWQRSLPGVRPTEIRGMTMGIVGLGGVGEALATRAQVFGMRVIGVRRSPGNAPQGVDAVWGPEGLPRLLAESDVVVLLLPGTPETAGSFGEAQLRQMKASALLINVGRGQVVDGAALERALAEGWIAGAGLDVMPEEPWPAESPLWHMDHVIITPHIAGNSPQRAGRDLESIIANLERFVRGERLVGEVGLATGY